MFLPVLIFGSAETVHLPCGGLQMDDSRQSEQGEGSHQQGGREEGGQFTHCSYQL